MKRTIYTTAMVAIASLMLAGLAVGSGMGAKDAGTSAVEGHMGGAAMEMATQHLDMNQVRELQKLLNDQGYNVGVPDGVIGSSTTEAIRQFQLDNQLTNTGEPDPETLRMLSPDAEKQEFFGLAPEYGEQKEMMQPDSKKMMDKEMMEEMPKKMGY